MINNELYHKYIQTFELSRDSIINYHHLAFLFSRFCLAEISTIIVDPNMDDSNLFQNLGVLTKFATVRKIILFFAEYGGKSLSPMFNFVRLEFLLFLYFIE